MPKEQLITLIEKYLDESIQPDEHALLAILMKDDKHIEQFKSIILEELSNKRLELEPNEQIGISIRQRVQERLEEASYSIRSSNKNRLDHRIHFLKTTWFKYAAAIIILLGISSYLWFNNTTTTNPINQKNPLNPSSDNLPGSNKALLTLANGQQILLDSTQGNIVKQANLTVINLSGKLKYEGMGTNAEYNTISTPKGGQYQIILPDGSKVWLNAASSMKFPTAFTGSIRQVEMTGEAYMEVAQNAKQSFVVKANGIEIQVLGTSFNINAYPDENAIKTTLISGSVKVVSNTTSGILKPGQQAIINHSENANINKMLIQPADTEQTLAWKNGIFQLEGSSLEEIMRQVARWYDVKIVYETKVPSIQLWGKMKRDLSLSQVLNGLSEIGLKLRKEGNRLIVME